MTREDAFAWGFVAVLLVFPFWSSIALVYAGFVAGIVVSR